MNKYILVGFVCFFLFACGEDSTNTSNGGSTTTTGIRFDAVGSFSSTAATLMKTATGSCASLSNNSSDDPSLQDGLDCDEDGGIVAHITPDQYAIAFKRVTLVSGGSESIDIIADKQTLANSQVVSFTTSDSSETLITINPEDLTPGTYTGVEVEIYYFQLTFPVAGVTRNVRIYMSDDDFAAQGNLGHHQGDITFIDDTGTELGWVDSTWVMNNLATTRGTDQNGAGGIDAETNHARGFFGDTTFWNTSDQTQGTDQDIFVTTLDFPSALVIPAVDTITDLTTITATYSVAETFYYEDFAPQGTGFFPDTGGEATSESAEWAPLVPTAQITVSTSE